MSEGARRSAGVAGEWLNNGVDGVRNREDFGPRDALSYSECRDDGIARVKLLCGFDECFGCGARDCVGGVLVACVDHCLGGLFERKGSACERLGWQDSAKLPGSLNNL